MSDELRLVRVQVIVQFAHEEDGEIGELLPPIAFEPSPAEWKRGWDWQAAFATALDNLLTGPPAPVD